MDKNNKISKDLEDLENLYKKKTISEDVGMRVDLIYHYTTNHEEC